VTAGRSDTSSFHKCSKSNVTSSHQPACCVHCQRASTSKDLRQDDDDNGDDDDDDDADDINVHTAWTHVSALNPSKCAARVENHSSSDPRSSTTCSLSNRARCKHGCCCVTSSQVRGGGKSGRHQRRTDECCCCQPRARCHVTKRKQMTSSDMSTAKTDSRSCCSTSPTCSCNDSSIDDDDDICDVMPRCYCCSVPGCLLVQCSTTASARLAAVDETSPDCCVPAACCCPRVTPASCPLVVSQCPLLTSQCPTLCCVEEGLARCRRSNCRQCCTCSSPVICAMLAGQCRPVHGICAAPVHRRRKCKCLHSQSVSLTRPAGTWSCSTTDQSSTRPPWSTTDQSNTRPPWPTTDQSSSRPPVYDCGTGTGSQTTATVPHFNISSTDELLQSRQTVSSGHSAHSTGTKSHSKVKSAEQSKWRFSAEKRRVSAKTVAAAASERPCLVTSTTPTTTTDATTTTTTTTTTATTDKHDDVAGVSSSNDRRRSSVGSRDTGTCTATSPIYTQLPSIATDLADVTSTLCTRLTQPLDKSSSVMPSGDELRQLVDAIAGIERDVRDMATALQTTDVDNTHQRRQQLAHAVGGPESVMTGPGSNKSTAAVALLLPPAELAVSSDHTQTQATHIQTSHGATNTLTQTTSKDTKTRPAALAAAAHPTRVMVLPTSTDNTAASTTSTGKQSDYSKYTLLPASGSKLPFRLATTDAGTGTAQMKLKNRTTGEAAGTANYTTTARVQTSADREDEMQTVSESSSAGSKPHFTGIQQIIRQLESINAAASTPVPLDTVAAKPKQQRQVDSGVAHSVKKPNATVLSNDRGSGGVTAAKTLRNASTSPSPLDLVQISTKQTQTSPKSSVQSPLLHDDKNMTVKSRSLESQQQQQQLNNAAASSVVTPLALPRSSAAVTTATQSVAIPLPPASSVSPAGIPPDGDVETTDTGTEDEASRPDQALYKNYDKAESKRKHL